MYCLKCGQERISEETNYCSRCGFLLAGAAELIRSGGVLPQLSAKGAKKVASPRKRGLKQGLFIFLLTFLVLPIMAIIAESQHSGEMAPAIAAILLSMGGLLRMAYALIFESGEAEATMPIGANVNSVPVLPLSNAVVPNLPPQRSYPAADYISPSAGKWIDTNELQPVSVVEATTKLLEHEKRDQ
jgi:hypothetical protein